ncbi:hypothetical protein [Gordonia sp. NPDC003585]|uniref:hypothetical protein n=1 Tax=Gordonia sp. NPDC003585 TaxID=3154275 RepID=UPI0033BC458E
MTPRSDLPDPPYSAELLADLDAGVLPDDVAAHMFQQIAHDTSAQAVLRSLTDTRRDLADSATHMVDVPDDVRARVDATLDDLAAAPPSRARSHPPRTRILSVAAVVLMFLVVGVSVLVVMASSDDPEPPVAASSTPATPSRTLSGAELASALAVLGHSDNAPFGSATALRRCLAANGVPDDAVVVGSGPITTDGQPAAVILLSTGVAGRFDALVVGTDCDTGHPSTITRTTIGAP